jgi:hypothetical protein
MAALTLTPKTNDDKKVYSDGTTSNQITINVQTAGAPLSVTKLTGKVSDSSGMYVGAVSTGVTSTGGDIVLTVGAPVSGALTLTLYANAQTSGSMPLAAVVFQPITLTNNPALASASQPVVATATILDALGKPVDGVPLAWRVLNQQLGIAPTFVTTQSATPSTYQYTLRALTEAEITALPTPKVHLSLVIGPPAGNYSIEDPVPTVPPLLAPTLPVSMKHPPVIDDDLIDACEDIGVAFAIPAIANASVGDFITLFAASSASANTNPRVLLLKPLDDTMIAGQFLMLVPTENDVFTENGPEYVYYTVFRSQLGGALATSEQLQVLVDRRYLPTLPDGNPDSRLTAPHVAPVVYAGDNNKNYLTATINFNGQYQPKVGDTITTKLYLLGYTNANLNWTPQPPIPPIVRVLTAANFTVLGEFIPFTVSFTPSQLAGIDGSNGQVYFILQRGSVKVRSPSCSIVVDTVPAYTGSIARMLALS